jgi:hypothetical protein
LRLSNARTHCEYHCLLQRYLARQHSRLHTDLRPASRSHDLLVLARVALESAIRSETDLLILLYEAVPVDQVKAPVGAAA